MKGGSHMPASSRRQLVLRKYSCAERITNHQTPQNRERRKKTKKKENVRLARLVCVLRVIYVHTFDLGSSVPAMRAAQPIFGLLFQQLLANRLGLFSELGRVWLGGFTDPSIHLLPFDFLFTSPKRRLAFNHFINEAAKTEEIRAERVLFIVNDFRSWKKKGKLSL